MAKTALELTPDELKQYKPFSRLLKRKPNIQRWQRAWAVAKEAANILYERFSAGQVIVFGSLVDSTMFTQWSDIDIAVSGLSVGSYFKALSEISVIDMVFEIDLVPLENCKDVIRFEIEKKGVTLYENPHSLRSQRPTH